MFNGKPAAPAVQKDASTMTSSEIQETPEYRAMGFLENDLHKVMIRLKEEIARLKITVGQQQTTLAQQQTTLAQQQMRITELERQANPAAQQSETQHSRVPSNPGFTPS